MQKYKKTYLFLSVASVIGLVAAITLSTLKTNPTNQTNIVVNNDVTETSTDTSISDKSTDTSETSKDVTEEEKESSEEDSKKEQKEEKEEKEEEEVIDPKLFNITETIRDNNNSSFKYGCYYLKYETELDDIDDITYDISYKEGGDVASEILDISFDKENQIITVGINNIFTHPIVLDFNSENNLFTSSKVTLDFEEQVELKTSFILEEGVKPSFTTEVNSTGGSITYEKNLGECKLSWNEDFLKEIKSRLKTSFFSYKDYLHLKEGYCLDIQYIKDDYYEGVNDIDLISFQNNNFYFENFYKSFYLSISCTGYDEYDIDSKIEQINLEYGLSNLSNGGDDLFDGKTKIFDYTVTFNGKEYSYSFGINKDNIRSQYRIEDHQTLYSND